MERKDSCSYLPRDDQSTGNFGMAKTFLIGFLLRPAALLSLGRVRILFPSANCPSGDFGGAYAPPQDKNFSLSLRTIGLVKQNSYSPSGQQGLLPQEKEK